MTNAEEILAIIKLVQDLTPVGVGLIKSLLNRLKGQTDEQIAVIAHSINLATIAEIDAELNPPKS